MAKANQAVATVDPKSQAMAQYEGYEEYAGQGLDDLTTEDKGLPFFEVLQPLSPEIEELGDAAKPGMIINKSTKELFNSIRFVPICRDHVYTEWVPRDSGGGLVGNYQLSDPIVAEARSKSKVGKHTLANGNELIETFYLYGLVLDDDDNATPAVIAFTSTKIAAYKTLSARADALMFKTRDGRKLKFPWYAHVWRLGTEKRKKDKYTWFTWAPAFDGGNDRAEDARLPPDSPIVRQASDLYASHKSGSVKLNTDGMRNDGPATTGTAGAGDDDIGDAPF